jgi:hypothetical protein
MGYSNSKPLIKYDSIKYFCIDNNKFIGMNEYLHTFNIQEYFIKDSIKYGNYDMDGYLLKNKYQNIKNVIMDYDRNNTDDNIIIGITNENDRIQIGIKRNKLFLIEIAESNDICIDKQNIHETINFINTHYDKDMFDCEVPKFIKSISYKKIDTELDYLKDIESYDMVGIF